MDKYSWTCCSSEFGLPYIYSLNSSRINPNSFHYKPSILNKKPFNFSLNKRKLYKKKDLFWPQYKGQTV